MNQPEKAESPKLTPATEATRRDETELAETELDAINGGTKNLQTIYQMITNIIKAREEAAKAVIRNIRG